MNRGEQLVELLGRRRELELWPAGAHREMVHASKLQSVVYLFDLGCLKAGFFEQPERSVMR